MGPQGVVTGLLVLQIALHAFTPVHGYGSLLSKVPGGFYSPELEQGLQHYLSTANITITQSAYDLQTETAPFVYTKFLDVLETLTTAIGPITFLELPGMQPGPVGFGANGDGEAQTVYLVDDDTMQSEFEALANLFNISRPESFLDRLVPIAQPPYTPSDGSNFFGTRNNSIPISPNVAAGIVLYNFIAMHVLESSIDINDVYNLLQEIDNSVFPRPWAQLFTRAAINATNTEGAEVSGTSANTPGGAGVVLLYAQGSLMHTNQNDTIRPSYDTLYAVNGDNVQYVQDVDGIFVYGGSLGVTNATVDCSSAGGIDCTTARGALEYLASVDF